MALFFPSINIHDIQFHNPMHQHSPVPFNHSNRFSFFVHAVLFVCCVSFTFVTWFCLVKRGRACQIHGLLIQAAGSFQQCLFPPSRAKLFTCPPSRAESSYLCGDHSKNKTCHLMVVWDGS